jgi:gamma-glutamylcyclotransferase (GGCT)/AIG2-like uncharacterized protein YtfP
MKGIMNTNTEIQEMYEQIRLPIAVYGTLRPGHGNSILWRGMAEASFDGEAYVMGYRLIGHGFPYAIPAASSQSLVTLITPHEDTYDQVLAEMDRLEGVGHGFYDRLQVTVVTPDGPVGAWMYVPSNKRGSGEEVRVNAEGRHDWNLGVKSRHDEEFVAMGWWR